MKFPHAKLKKECFLLCHSAVYRVTLQGAGVQLNPEMKP
jgi:hypothetical protein